MLGSPILRFNALPSTNEYARELLTKSAPLEGTAVIAASQSAGRGQFGSTWSSMAGKNLLVSVILYPHFLPPDRQFLLSQAVALAVADTAARFSQKQVDIKWPNDILLDRRKTAGILIQNAWSGQSWQSAVAGIGLNVNQTIFGEELPFATSLAQAEGHEFDLSQVETVLFENLTVWYDQLKRGAFHTIESAYFNRLYGHDCKTVFSLPDGSRFQGIIRNIDRSGRLGIERTGQVEYFDLKAVRMVLGEME